MALLSFMKPMPKFQLLIGAAALLMTPWIWAQEATPAPYLSREVLEPLLLNAKAEITTQRGNQLSWKNEADGALTAYATTPRGHRSSAPGTWRVNEQGRYCVSIRWPSGEEDWCRYVVREGDGYSLMRSNGEKVSPLKLSR